MQNKNKISVVIPCYNCEKSIEKTASFILQQTVLPDEIIYINDGSTDRTLELLKKIKAHSAVKSLIINQQNAGVSSARNAGIEKSEGNLIAFCDSDDYWKPTKLEVIKEFFENENINSVAHGYIIIGDDKKEKRCVYKGKKGFELLDEYLNSYIQTSTVVIRKKVFDSVGKFNDELVVAEDFDLWLRIIAYGGFHYINQCLSYYHETDENNNLSSNEIRMYENTMRVLSKNTGILRNLYGENKTKLIYKYRIMRLIGAEFVYQLKRKNIALVLDSFKTGIKWSKYENENKG